MSPTDHLQNKNTLSILFWPTFKSPQNDLDPTGIKTTGEFAVDANQDYSFSAILSEGRTNGSYKFYNDYGWKTYSGNPNFFRPLDTELAFVKGVSMSKFDYEIAGPNSYAPKWSPSDKEYLGNQSWKLITSGSYFTFNLNSGINDPGNSDKTCDPLIDSCKIYKSQYSGYMVNVKDYFFNANSWPTGYGTVSGPYDLFQDRNILNIKDTIFPQLPYGATKYMWDGEFLFRIPESEKDKIFWRDVTITVADFADYFNSWRKNSYYNPSALCVQYERSTGSYDDNISLCPPNCLTDAIGCPGFSFLSSAQAEVTSLTEKNGIKSIFWVDNKKGLYFGYPAAQVESINDKGVGSILSTFQGTNQVLEQFPFPNERSPSMFPQDNITTMSNAPEILSQGFGYNTKPNIKFQNVLSSNSILEEDFRSVISGRNNDIFFTGWVKWTGNNNFPNVNNAFQADGSIMLSGQNAYIQTSDLFLNLPENRFGLSIGLKGWNPIEGQLKISISGTDISKIYNFPTVNINANFQTIYDEFNSTTGRYLKFETTSGRLFLDNFRIFGPGGPASYERGWIIRCDKTKNFDNTYGALLYIPSLDFNSSIYRYGTATPNPAGFPTNSNQGLSALKNACLKFNKYSKKMIIFMCDSFPSYAGTINDYTSTISPYSNYFPYPSKQEVKKLLNEKGIILHSIAFNSSYFPYNFNESNNFVDKKYIGLSNSLKAFAPLTGSPIKDHNTLEGYVSPLEEVTLNLTGEASESKLWILNRYIPF